MDAFEPEAPDLSPEQAEPPRRFAGRATLGVVLVFAGVAMSHSAMGTLWEAGMAGRETPAGAGLAAMVVGAGILVWRAVVRFRRHGALAAVLAGVVAFGASLLLTYAVFVIVVMW